MGAGILCKYQWLMGALLILIVGCSKPQATESISRSTEAALINEPTTSAPTFTIFPSTSTGTVTSTPEPTITGTAASTPTSDPYEVYTIEYLTHRKYGDGSLDIQEVIADNSYFTRYLITYPSDGLIIYGFMNIPKRVDPPYPIVIALHGYIDPEIYSTLDYTTGYADAFARAGFLVIHPNLRNYPPSDQGDNLFRVGMAEDVLNLINIIKTQAGQTGSLEFANPNAIGIWGHSMGGGVSLRVLTISPDVKAAVLYGAMSGDEQRNFEAINRWSGGERGNEELAVPTSELDNISPINYLNRINAPVSIHHGEADDLVPIQWSIELCDDLTQIGKAVECFTYPGQPHTFNGDGETLFNQRVIDFFVRTLYQR